MMKLMDFINTNNVVLLDGGMGTEIEKHGEKPGKHLNLVPEKNGVISQIHTDYLESGSDIIIANTFVLNRIYDQTHNGDGEIVEACKNGVRIAKEAANKVSQRTERQCFVLGDMTGTGQMLEPYGDYSEEEFEENYYEQAKALSDAGADGIIVETMFDLNEALCAVRGIKKANSEIPIFVSMTYNTLKNGGRTFMGFSAAQCAQELEDAGVSAIGANCGDLTPEEVAQIIKIYKETVDLPLFAEPNAGMPVVVDGKTSFNMSPEDFAKGAKLCLEAGASIIGGCCGTTPEHIRQTKTLLQKS